MSATAVPNRWEDQVARRRAASTTTTITRVSANAISVGRSKTATTEMTTDVAAAGTHFRRLRASERYAPATTVTVKTLASCVGLTTQ